MTKFIAVAVICLLGLGVAWFFILGDTPAFIVGSATAVESRDGETSQPSPPPIIVEETGQYALAEKTEEGIRMIPNMIDLTNQLHDETQPAQSDLELLDQVFSFYRSMNKTGNPAGGENEDIVATLTGRDGRRVALISPDHPALSKKGQLLDRWGTPFHFHPLSSTRMDITSAGPDKKLWTDDDLKFPEPE